MFKRNYYFDYAGATPVSKRSRTAMSKVSNLFVNPSGIYKDGVKLKKIIQDCKSKILDLFDANNMHIVFTPSGTTSNNLAILGILKKGDHFITSSIEHPAVLEAAKHLEKGGVEVTYLSVDEEGLVNVNDIRKSIKLNTKLISVMMVNNEVGTVEPIKEIGRVVDEYRRKNDSNFPLFHTDACQAVNYFKISMRSLRLDMLSFNSSKIYGPKGIGALIYKKNVELRPVIFGGGQENNLWSGTEDVEKIVGFTEAILDSQKLRDKEVERFKFLQKYFWREIKKSIPDVVINGPIENRSPNNFNITLPGMDSDEMVLRLDNLGFAVSHKSACASSETTLGSHVLIAMGKSEYASQNIRITTGRDTTERDLRALMHAIKDIYYKYRKI